MSGCDRPAFIGTAGQKSMPRRSSFIRLFAKSGIHVGIEHLQRVMQRIAAGNYTFRSPVECCRGTSPIHAAKSRPDLKLLGSVTVEAIAVAAITPIPGMVSRRQLMSLAR